MAKVKQEELYSCAYKILLAIGENPKGAKIVADSLIRSDSRGTTTHGTYLLSPIVDRVRVNQLNLPTKTSIVVNESAVAIIDGGNGLGPVAGKQAVELAIKRASKFGISLVLIRNTNNVGSLSFYTEMIAKKGMIGLMGCNAAPAIAPWGASEAFMGTNPIAFAIFTGNDVLFSADLASSVVARGKIREADKKGQNIPDDWALDAEGNPTTDPVAALKGTLLPIGGPKGSAIALAVDIFSGILAGSAYGQNIKSFHTPEGITGVGATLMAIDIRKFMELDNFTLTIDKYITQLKNLKKADFTSEIFLPGEIEYKKELESKKNGILLENKAVDILNELLAQLGIRQCLESIE
jgi:LDH2 family malate/lactate/ureidoglycolate dehydrogenase